MGTRTPTYYTGTIDGTAGSLITVLDAALVTGEGWTKTYSGTNKAVYTQASGNGFCLRVRDDASGTGGGREALVRGGESATDVDTLVDPFPNTTQVTDANCNWRKSNTADSTARTYYMVADGSFFLLLILFDGSTARDLYAFGDTERYYSGDGYNTMIVSRTLNNSNNNGTCTSFSQVTGMAGGTAVPIMWFARSADGLVKSDHGFWLSNCASIGQASTTDPDYPNTATNKLHLGLLETISVYSNTVAAIQSGAMFRGTIPHCLEPILGSGTGTLAEGDTFKDSAYANTDSSLMLLALHSGTFSTAPKLVFQIAGTWDPGH